MRIFHVNPIKLHGEAWSIAFGPPTWTSKAMPVATQNQFARNYLGNAQSAAHLPGLLCNFWLSFRHFVPTTSFHERRWPGPIQCSPTTAEDSIKQISPSSGKYLELRACMNDEYIQIVRMVTNMRNIYE